MQHDFPRGGGVKAGPGDSCGGRGRAWTGVLLDDYHQGACRNHIRRLWYGILYYYSTTVHTYGTSYRRVEGAPRRAATLRPTPLFPGAGVLSCSGLHAGSDSRQL